MPEVPTITVGRLRKELELYDDDCELSFSGLSFYRAKTRDENLVQIEFNESVYLDGNGDVQIQK